MVVRRFRAAEGDVLPVSQSKLERRCVSSMSDMLGSSHFSFLTGLARAVIGSTDIDLRRIAAALLDRYSSASDR